MSAVSKKSKASKRRDSVGSSDPNDSAKKARLESGLDYDADTIRGENPTSDNEDIRLGISVPEEHVNPAFNLIIRGKKIVTWNDNISPLDTFDLQERQFSQDVNRRFAIRSLSDGPDVAVNLFSVNPEDLKITNGFLNQTDKKTMASFFFLTGIATYSALVECNNNYGVYAVAVKPWDFTWSRTFTTMAAAFNVRDVYIKTLARGIYFKTAQKDSKIDPHGPIRPSAPLHVKDGTNVFRLADIDSLPDLSDDVKEGTPVLITFSVRLTDWRPKVDNKNSYRRYEDGCKKQLSFYIRNIVALAETEHYDDMSTLATTSGLEPEL